MRENIKRRGVLETDKVVKVVKDDAGEALLKSRRSKSQRKDGALQAGDAAISEQEERVGDGELVREEAKVLEEKGCSICL